MKSEFGKMLTELTLYVRLPEREANDPISRFHPHPQRQSDVVTE
jgi:hypothetical protein